MTTPVTYRLERQVAHIDLAQPTRGNPMSMAMARALNDFTARAVEDGARVVVLDAAGTSFCVGGDLKEIHASEDPGRVVAHIAQHLHAAVYRLLTMDAIVLSVVRGVAAGAGFPLAMAGDIVLASETAGFVMAYTDAGLTPDGGSTLLVDAVGRHRAMQLMLLNPCVSSRELQRLGLIAEIVSSDQVDDARDRLIDKLIRGSAEAQIATKRLVRATLGDPQSTLDREGVAVVAAARSTDGRKGVRAFNERRAAQSMDPSK